MLTKNEIENNKSRFKDLVTEITRLSDDSVHNILEYLDDTDFFTAPASTKYHGAYEGGLCEHCLHVYDNLKKLYDTFHFLIPAEDSLLVIALFHDAAKINFYKKELRNKKDDAGKWYSYEAYTYKDASERFFVGNHEGTSAYLVSTLIPLYTEEYAAILNHHGGMSWDSTKAGAPEVFQKYPIAQYLYFADCIDAYDTNVR